MKNKIAIIAPANLKYVPYINGYLDILDSINQQYVVISWNKVGIKEDNVAYSFDFVVQDEDRVGMMRGYIKFSQFCKRVIKKEKIDKLIILTAAPAFFIGNLFLKNKTYLLDIRDDSPLIRVLPKRFSSICNNAKKVIASSPNFSEWIPCKTDLCHNVDMVALYSKLPESAIPPSNGIYRIVFAGMMNEADINIKYLDSIKEDKRFINIFWGRNNPEKQRIIDFAASNNITDIEFHDVYDKSEITGIYHDNADFVNIIREDCVVNRNALPNKMYDAVLAGVPIVVFRSNNAIVRYVEKYNLGVVIEENDISENGDVLYSKMSSFDYELFAEGRNQFINEIKCDMQEFGNIVKMFSEV